MEYDYKRIMTLDEAIEHALEKSKNTDCIGCAQEHYQLAKWLIELKEYRNKSRIN